MKVQTAMHKGVEWVGPDTPIELHLPVCGLRTGQNYVPSAT
jgi:hypothetical protein